MNDAPTATTAAIAVPATIAPLSPKRETKMPPGNVHRQRADAAQRDDQARNGDRRAKLLRKQGDDRQHGALADGEDEARQVDAEREVADLEGLFRLAGILVIVNVR